MKNVLVALALLFCITSCTKSEAIDPVVEQDYSISIEKSSESAFIYNVVVQFKPNNCWGERGLWSQMYNELNALLGTLGTSMAITEIHSNSWEVVNGVPLCQCRFDRVLAQLNLWCTANGVPTVNPNGLFSTSCTAHPGILTGNPVEHLQVVIVIHAFL